MLSVCFSFLDLTCFGQKAILYINDTTDPTLRSFSVDFLEGKFTLTFSETVDVSTFNATQITLQDSTAPVSTYTLTNPSTVVTMMNSPVVEFLVHRTDLNAIKDDPQIFTTIGTSYIRLTNRTVIDMSYNPVVRLDVSEAIRATEYIEDLVPPNLESYHLNLTANTISLTFDEAVDLETLQVSSITLHSNSSGGRSINLAAVPTSETIDSRGLVVTFMLSEANVRELKAFTDFGTTLNNTLLTTTTGLIEDNSRLGNSNNNITLANALMVSVIYADTVSPRLDPDDPFPVFDVERATFRLRFDEPVDINSVNFSRITIFALPDSPINYTLTGGVATYVAGSFNTLIEISLNENDRFNLVSNSELATRRSNTYVQLDDGAITDTSGILFKRSDVIQTGEVMDDEEGPRALGFQLDLDEGNHHYYV